MLISTLLAIPRRAGILALLAAGGIGWTGVASAQSVPTFGTVTPAPVINYERAPGTNSLAGNDALTTVRNVDRTAAGLSNIRPYCGEGFTVSPAGTTCVPDVAVVEPAPVVQTYVPPPQPVVVQAPPPPPPPPVAPIAAAPPVVAPVPVAAAGLSNTALVAGGVGVLALAGIVALIASDSDDSSSTTTTQ